MDVGRFDRSWIRYGITIGVVAVGFLLRLALTNWVGPGLPTYVTFYPAVMLIAIAFGLWSGLLATIMLALISAYWILPPEGFAIGLVSDLVGLCVFLVMGVLISVVAEFYHRARKQAYENSLKLTRANEALRRLSSKLLSAEEEERKRIAGEIHDNLGGYLSAIKFKAEAAIREQGRNANAAIESLETIVPIIQEGVEECRRIQQDLRPSILDDLGLLPALTSLCRRFETIYSHIRTEQTFRMEEDEIPSALKIVTYRVVQEAMNNIAKHSKANLVHLSLRKVDRRMEVTIQDNGQGFNLESLLSRESTKKGLGLSSMRERTEFSGGSFGIESIEGQGTIIRASWPIEPLKP